MGQWPRLCLPVVAVLMLGGVCRAQGAVRTPLSTPELGALPPWVSRVTAAQGEPPGTTIVVNSLGRWPFGVKADGVIHLEEAFSYAAQDPAANQILFASALDGPNGIVFDDRWFGGETLSGDGDSIVGDFGSWDPRVKLAEELYVTGSSCTVRGLCLRWCEVSGDDNRVRACHFGLDLDGETSWAPGYVYGLNVTGNRNTIGGDRVWYRNHFGRAAGGPVGVNGSENVFCTNVVGLKPDLWTPLDDPPTSGVWVGGHHNQIGGIENRFNCIYATDTCMDIGGNTGDDGHHNAIRMNYLGQNNAKAKCKYGLVIEDGARGNIIGGPVSPEYGPNVIVNFTVAGIMIEPRCHGTTIVGSCIGMDQWGNGVAPDEPAWGVVVGRSVSGTKIGSSAPTQRNRFGRPGIRIREGATNTVIRGNWMGLDDANRPVGAEYYHHGIEAIGAERLTIGGQHRSGADEGNLLVGHAVAIHLTDCTGPVVIEGNTIGALPDRSAPAGGRGFGITLEGCASVRIGPRIAETTASGGEAPTGVPSSLYGNLIMPGRGSIGISLGSCSSVQIEGNLIGWEDPAAAPGGDQGIRVGLACRAIRIGGSLGNRICRNDQNVGVYGADDVTLTNNKIRSATAGDGVLIGF
ncbi:MAG: hypothetical protein FJX74_21825, partial [Armatimonadetes bacterium]|nr:hypothetical protein [Armatimonadota bacterium]